MSAVSVITRCLIFLLAMVLANSIDPQFLRRRPRTTAASIPSSNELTDLYNQLSGRVTELETALNSERQMTLMANRQIVRQQDQITRAEQHISEMRISILDGCSCGPGGSGPDSGSDRGHADGEWVSNLDGNEIQRIIDGFYSASSAGNRDRGGDEYEKLEEGDDEDNAVELRPEAISAFSRAFAQLLTREVTDELGEQPVIPTDSTQSDETEDEPTAIMERTGDSPSRPRPPPGSRHGFNYRPTRSLRHPRRAGKPDDAALDEVTKQLEDVFTDLLRARKRGAFSAIRTSIMLGIKNVSQVITYEKTLMNKGKQLNRKLGFFNCTIPGVYYFAYTMRSYDEKLIGVVLMLNNAPVVAVTTDAGSRNVMQSQSVMLTLKKGDLVWLLLGPNGNFGIYSSVKNKYITFNGVYLFK